MRTLSEVIREQDVDRIDLLKIDAEKSELEVLEGIQAEDWGLIRQVVVEVHDAAGRLAHVTALLRQHGYQVTIEQDAALAATDLYNVYARRLAENGQVSPGASTGVTEPAGCTTPKQLEGELRRFLGGKVPEHWCRARLCSCRRCH